MRVSPDRGWMTKRLDIELRTARVVSPTNVALLRSFRGQGHRVDLPERDAPAVPEVRAVARDERAPRAASSRGHDEVSRDHPLLRRGDGGLDGDVRGAGGQKGSGVLELLAVTAIPGRARTPPSARTPPRGPSRRRREARRSRRPRTGGGRIGRPEPRAPPGGSRARRPQSPRRRPGRTPRARRPRSSIARRGGLRGGPALSSPTRRALRATAGAPPRAADLGSRSVRPGSSPRDRSSSFPFRPIGASRVSAARTAALALWSWLFEVPSSMPRSAPNLRVRPPLDVVQHHHHAPARREAADRPLEIEPGRAVLRDRGRGAGGLRIDLDRSLRRRSAPDRLAADVDGDSESHVRRADSQRKARAAPPRGSTSPAPRPRRRVPLRPAAAPPGGRGRGSGGGRAPGRRPRLRARRRPRPAPGRRGDRPSRSLYP